MREHIDRSQLLDELGTPRGVYRPPLWRFIAPALLFAPMGTLMLVLWNQERDPTMLAVGIAFWAGAIGLAGYRFRIAGNRILLSSEGFATLDRGKVDVYRWGEIVAVRETKVADHVHFIPLGSYRAAEIQRADGKRLFINRNRIAKVGQLIDAIQKELWAHRSRTSATDPGIARIVAAWPRLSEPTRQQISDLIDAQKSATG